MSDQKLLSNQFSPDTVEGWIDWAYHLGLKLDQHVPWSNVDNRERIERFVLMALAREQRERAEFDHRSSW